MRVDEGFVAVTPDGEYLIWSERITHTGFHLDCRLTPHIDQALSLIHISEPTRPY